MNVLKRPGNIIISVLTLTACLGGSLVCLMTLVGFAYRGFDSLRFNTMAAIVVLSTVLLFLGLLGAGSPIKFFAISALLGSASMFLVVAIYLGGLAVYSHGTPTSAYIWTLFLVLVELSTLVLSAYKYRQLNEVRP